MCRLYREVRADGGAGGAAQVLADPVCRGVLPREADSTQRSQGLS